MKTLIAVLAGTAIILSAGAQAKFIESDSPNNSSVQNELNMSVIQNAIAHQGYGYLAIQQNMAEDPHTFYPTSSHYQIDDASKLASITTNQDIAEYLSVR